MNCPTWLLWLCEPFEFEFMRRAMLVCALVGFTNGFLGAYVVIRRLALMADALAHSLLPGLAVAAILVGLSPKGLLFGGIIAGLLVVLGGQLLSRSTRIKEETSIACLYILAFAGGITLIRFANVKVDLLHFLFGNILGVGDVDLWTCYIISGIVLLTVVTLERPLLVMLFEPAVARTQGVRVNFLQLLLLFLIVLAMIASLQAVGVLLALGLLILPAATLFLLFDSFGKITWGSGLLGVFGAFTGLLASYHLNIPSGPAIVMVLGLLFVTALLFSPRYGVLVRALRRRHLHEESLRRWKK